MLLTLKPPVAHTPIGASYPGVNDYSSSSSLPKLTSRYTSASSGSSPPPPLHSSHSHSTPQPPLPASNTSQVGMTTQPPHRAFLPLPPNMPQPSPLQNPADQIAKLPAPPTSWDHRSEDGMRNWLQAKAEEDRRRQEEEKTRQEGYRLEQRKIEQSMLHESLERGVPPPMVPIIFAGLAGSSVPMDTTLQWSQHFLETMRQQELQTAEMRRYNAPGSLASNPYSAGNPPPGSVPPGQAKTQPTGYLAYNQTPSTPGRQGHDSASVSAPPPPPPPPPPSSAARADSGRLPRLTTGEMQPQPPPPPSAGSHLGTPSGQVLHPLQQAPGSQIGPMGSQDSAAASSQQQPSSQQQQQQPSQNQSPSIYFYHWQPPGSGASGSSNAPNTPSEYVTSPPKRRKTSQHPSTSQPANTSPSFSQTTSAASTPGMGRRQAHTRNRSEATNSLKGFESYPRAAEQTRSGSIASGSSPDERSSTTKSAIPEERQRVAGRYSAGPELSAAALAGEQESRPDREYSQPPPAFKRDDTKD